MASVPQNEDGGKIRAAAFAPHSWRDGVEGKVCGGLPRSRVAKNPIATCGQWKPLDQFNIAWNYGDGRSLDCVMCRRAHINKYRAAQREAQGQAAEPAPDPSVCCSFCNTFDPQSLMTVATVRRALTYTHKARETCAARLAEALNFNAAGHYAKQAEDRAAVSAPPAVHRCGECDKTPDETRFRTGGSGKLRRYCEACARERDRAKKQPSTPQDKAIVRFDHEAMAKVKSIGDVRVGWIGKVGYWPVREAVEAAGLDWSAQYKRIMGDARMAPPVAVTATIDAGIGNRNVLCLPWSTFHLFWNGVDLARINEASRPIVTRVKREAAEALALVFGDTAEEVTADRPVEERVMAAAAALDPQADRHRELGELFETLIRPMIQREVEAQRQAQSNDDEVPVEKGICYSAVNTKAGLIAIGKAVSPKTAEERMKDSDYNGAKAVLGRWGLDHFVHTDNCGAVEKKLHELARLAGYTPVPGKAGTFIYDERLLEEFRKLPKKLAFKFLLGAVNERRIFLPPMFGGAL